MSEVKDPKIKLFGRTIELPENSAAADESCEPGSARSCEPAAGDGSSQDPPCSSDSMVEDSNFMGGEAAEQESFETPSSLDEHLGKEDDENSTGPSKPDGSDDSTTTDPNKPAAGNMTQKPEEEQPEMAGDPNEKALKKPDKILPCPRCNSMDTKFCYFNNYNVNQPRHFCKNCQRYWTAGGTMRNIPVGAGRRKNKSSSTAAAHFRPLEAFHHGPGRATDGTVLAFGDPDSPLCDSISSTLSIADHTSQAGPKPEQRAPLSQWAYHHPWGPAQWAVPFYPATPPPSFWGWSVPCIVPTVGIGPGPNSPTLGKHSREGEAAKEKRSDPEKCLWVPKTLRIDDPIEAAKSSIWATLGIKNEGRPGSGKGGGGLFKAFDEELKGRGKAQVPEASMVLQANPAALSRVWSFHESS